MEPPTKKLAPMPAEPSGRQAKGSILTRPPDPQRALPEAPGPVGEAVRHEALHVDLAVAGLVEELDSSAERNF